MDAGSCSPAVQIDYFQRGNAMRDFFWNITPRPEAIPTAPQHRAQATHERLVSLRNFPSPQPSSRHPPSSNITEKDARDNDWLNARKALVSSSPKAGQRASSPRITFDPTNPIRCPSSGHRKRGQRPSLRLSAFFARSGTSRGQSWRKGSAILRLKGYKVRYIGISGTKAVGRSAWRSSGGTRCAIA